MDVYERKIFETADGDGAVILKARKYAGRYYLDLREYFVGFDGEWAPTKTGISLPLTLSTVPALFDALLEFLDSTEADHLIKQYARFNQQSTDSV